MKNDSHVFKLLPVIQMFLFRQDSFEILYAPICVRLSRSRVVWTPLKLLMALASTPCHVLYTPYVSLGSEGSKMTQNFVKSSVFSSFEQVNRLESQKSVSNALESVEDKVILAGSGS